MYPSLPSSTVGKKGGKTLCAYELLQALCESKCSKNIQGKVRFSPLQALEALRVVRG
jgi:hypothetical protein